MRRLIAGLLFVMACGGATEPKSKAGDPSLLITNNLQSDWVFVTWRDGQGIVGRDSVAPQTANQCVRFLAQPDSAQWSLVATATDGGWGDRTSSTNYPWFNPATRPAWRVVISGGSSASPLIMTTLMDTPC